MKKKLGILLFLLLCTFFGTKKQIKNKKIIENHPQKREHVTRKKKPSDTIFIPKQMKFSSPLEKKIATHLLKFQGPETSIHIQKKDTIVEKEKIFYKFKISYRHKDHPQTSFHALVHSQTGKILRTWDRTIVDKYHHTWPTLEAVEDF